MFLLPRREIYSGYSKRRFVELRDRLQAQGVPISYRLTSVSDGGRRKLISSFQMATHYRLYARERRFFEKKLGKKL